VHRASGDSRRRERKPGEVRADSTAPPVPVQPRWGARVRVRVGAKPTPATHPVVPQLLTPLCHYTTKRPGTRESPRRMSRPRCMRTEHGAWPNRCSQAIPLRQLPACYASGHTMVVLRASSVVSRKNSRSASSAVGCGGTPTMRAWRRLSLHTCSPSDTTCSTWSAATALGSRSVAPWIAYFKPASAGITDKPFLSFSGRG